MWFLLNLLYFSYWENNDKNDLMEKNYLKYDVNYIQFKSTIICTSKYVDLVKFSYKMMTVHKHLCTCA